MARYRYRDPVDREPATLGSLSLCLVWGLLLAMTLIYGYYKGVQFDVQIGGHLKRAADANSIQLAGEELNTALANMERSRRTSGSSHILWATPKTDIGFWYKNIKSSHDELKNLSVDVSPLEKSNMLIKLRETLMDHGEHGDHVTVPSNISLFPYQNRYSFCVLISVVILVCALIVYGLTHDL